MCVCVCVCFTPAGVCVHVYLCEHMLDMYTPRHICVNILQGMHCHRVSVVCVCVCVCVYISQAFGACLRLLRMYVCACVYTVMKQERLLGDSSIILPPGPRCPQRSAALSR